MSNVIFFKKAHVRAYEREGKQGPVHVQEYENKRPSAQWTPKDIFAGLQAHARGLREAAESATAPRGKPTTTRTDTPPQKPEQKKPALRSVPQQQPKEEQAPQPHQIKPPQVFVTAMQRVKNGAKLNEVMSDFTKMPIVQQHRVDQWLVLTKHPLSNHPGSTAERFRLLVQGTHQRIKEKHAKREKPPEIETPAPAAIVSQQSHQREDESKQFTEHLESYPEGSKFTIPVASDKKIVGTWQKVTIGGEQFWKKGNQYKTSKEFLRYKDSVTKQLAEVPKEKKPQKKIVITAQQGSKMTEGKEKTEQAFTPAHVGKTETVRTDQGAKIDVQYAVVEADKPIASHDTAFKVNPEFPAELQPRDRSRAASETQIQGILANFQPELLGANPKASDGAPIVGPDGAVEVGNGRTIALRRAYEGNLPEAGKYKAWLQEHAEDFGLSKEHVSGLKQPMLVRVRQTDVNRQEFVHETNKPSAAVYSPAEQAKNDARLLTPGLMQQFSPEPEAGVMAAENRSFVRGFLQGLTKEEAGSLTGSKGELSQAGALRIKNALLHRAYGNSDLVEQIAESTDDAAKNVSNALVAAAPRIAALKADIEAGNAHPVDLTPDIAQAALKLSSLKAQGESVDSYLAQMDLMAPDLTPESRELLAAFDQYTKKPQHIRNLLHGYVDFMDRAGNPKEAGLFGKPVTPTKAEAVHYAIQQAEKKGVLAASWAKLTGLIATMLRKAHVRGYERKGPSGQEVEVSEYESTREKKLKPGDPHPLHPHLEPSTTEHRALAAQRGVKVPPVSWGLTISPTADAKVQATWYDSTGKKQYGYHQNWIAAQSEKKFAAIQQMDSVVPEIEQKIAEDLKREDAHPSRVAAAVVSLIHKAYIRVGSEKYAQEHDTYGASSLRKQHVEVGDKGITLRFVGKHGKAHEKAVEAPELAPVLQHLHGLPGDRLFQFRHKDGLSPLTEQHVRDYLAPHGITPKSFRTYHATRLAAEALSKLGKPKDEQEAKKNITHVVKQVSEQLGNTPAVCRANYINPAVLDAYVKGVL